MQLSACWLLAGVSLAALVAGAVAARMKLHAEPPPPPHAADAGTKPASTATAAGVPPQQQPSASTSTSGQQGGDASDPRLDEAVAFLDAHLPARDSGRISQQRLRQHAQLALAARDATPWGTSVPWQLWLNDVLPHRSVDEPLDAQDWRPMFFERFMPLVAHAQSLGEAAQILNRDIWAACGGLHFVPDQTPEIMSVAQVLAAGYASCTGLSIFLVAACRAVGIPARVAGTPSWVEDRRDAGDRFNNHCWVEVWTGGAWSFTGACEYNHAGLNKTWFFPEPAQRQLPGDKWHAIYAASYAPTATPFPLAWAPEDSSVHGVDVTQAYLDAAAADVPPS